MTIMTKHLSKYVKGYESINNVKYRDCLGCKYAKNPYQSSHCYNCVIIFNNNYKPRFRIKKRVLRKWSNE